MADSESLTPAPAPAAPSGRRWNPHHHHRQGSRDLNSSSPRSPTQVSGHRKCPHRNGGAKVDRLARVMDEAAEKHSCSRGRIEDDREYSTGDTCHG